jgi:hypothetical protein
MGGLHECGCGTSASGVLSRGNAVAHRVPITESLGNLLPRFPRNTEQARAQPYEATKALISLGVLHYLADYSISTGPTEDRFTITVVSTRSRDLNG